VLLQRLRTVDIGLGDSISGTIVGQDVVLVKRMGDVLVEGAGMLNLLLHIRKLVSLINNLEVFVVVSLEHLSGVEIVDLDVMG